MFVISKGDHMKKKFFLILFLSFIIFASYTQSFRLDGNAHVFSYNDLKQILSTEPASFSANEFYRSYDNLRNSCGNNDLLFEEKCKTEFANRLIKISGRVKQIRKSILGEYIVELGTTETWAWNIGVVYPEKISQAMKSELMKLREGDYFEAIVITRSTYLYVDVPVWNSNGTYRTEP